MKKYLSIFAVLFVLVMPMLSFVFVAQAQSNLDVWQGADTQFENIGFDSNTDPKAVAVAVINIMMGFLGLIAVVIVLMGGFKWMTAGGNEDKVSEAKKILGAGVIGLFIIIASYGLAQWLIKAIVDVI